MPAMPRKRRGAHVIARHRDAVLPARDAAAGGEVGAGAGGAPRGPVGDPQRDRDEAPGTSTEGSTLTVALQHFLRHAVEPGGRAQVEEARIHAMKNCESANR